MKCVSPKQGSCVFLLYFGDAHILSYLGTPSHFQGKLQAINSNSCTSTQGARLHTFSSSAVVIFSTSYLKDPKNNSLSKIIHYENDDVITQLLGKIFANYPSIMGKISPTVGQYYLPKNWVDSMLKKCST